MSSVRLMSTVRQMLAIVFTWSYLKSRRLPWRGWKLSTSLAIRQELSWTKLSLYVDPEQGGVWFNVYGYDDKFITAVGMSPAEARDLAAHLMEVACHEEAMQRDMDRFFSNEVPF